MKARSNGHLRLDPKNARRHPERNQKMIADSLAELGAGRSILVDAGDTIIAGNGVYEQAQKLGLKVKVIESDGKTLYAIKRKDLKGARARRMALLDNRSTETSEWDSDVLAQIAASERELLEGLFDDKELREIIGTGEPKPEPVDAGELIDKAAELQKKWQVKRGDIWQIGKHRLMCGDSTSKEDIERLMGGEKAALMTTDPPYGVDYGELVGSRKNQKKGGWDDIENDALTDDELLSLLTASLDGAGAKIAFVWHPPGARRFLFWQALEANKYRVAQEIVWVKNALVFGRADYQWQHEPCLYAKREGAGRQEDRTQTTVWQVNKPTDSQHPTQKPIELFMRPIQNHTSIGEIVYDPFLGSGTTLVACEQTGRIGFGMEIEPKYCAVTLERLTNLGLTAKRVTNGNGKAR